jgi:non-ribosomal peptide synthase protein (TIGR01720 family)
MPAQESCGQTRDPKTIRPYLLDINSRIAGGQLNIVWTYSENQFGRDTIDALSRKFIASIRDIIAACQTPKASGFTPSDFPLLNNLNQQKLDKLISIVSKSEG